MKNKDKGIDLESIIFAKPVAFAGRRQLSFHQDLGYKLTLDLDKRVCKIAHPQFGHTVVDISNANWNPED